jgi:hypothetical protein
LKWLNIVSSGNNGAGPSGFTSKDFAIFSNIFLPNIIFYCSLNHRIFFYGLFMEVHTEIKANISTNTS